jgi:hypothetical protein
MNFENNYIILYIDGNKYEKIVNNILKFKNNKLNIISLLLNNEIKKYENLNNNLINITEIYTDPEIELSYLEKSVVIIYISKYKRSNILNDFLIRNKKLILFRENKLEDELDILINNKIDNNDYNEIIIKHLNEFNNINLLPIVKYNILKNNIKIIINKKNIVDKEKIFVVTVYKNTDNNNINLLQKKCILENINNKDVSKILIIGFNLEYEIKELLETYNNKIIIHNIDKNISYKDIINSININCINNIVFLLRSDIIIPNQSNLDFVDLKLNSKEIYALSRLDRYGNGNIVKSNKLNSLLFSTEQDAWIFNVPIKFKNKSLQKLEHIYFYDKYTNQIKSVSICHF